MTDKEEHRADEGQETNHIGDGFEVFTDQSQRIFAAAGSNGNDDDQSDDNADEAFANDQAGSEEYAAMITSFNVFFYMVRAAAFCTLTQMTVNEPITEPITRGISSVGGR